MAWNEKLDFLEYVLGRVFTKTWEQLEKFIFSNAVEYVTFNHLIDTCKNHDDLKALAIVYSEKI